MTTLLKNRRIVLIGGAGFIGHHLALKLKSLGAQTRIIDSLDINNYNYFKNQKDVIPNADLYLKIIQQRLQLLEENHIPLDISDARDYGKLSSTIASFNPDTIIHLAAIAHAEKANKDPYSTFDHNLRTLENALDIARSNRLNVSHFVYFSSSMVYGHFPEGEVTEEIPCNPLGIYGALKYSGEKIVISYNQVFDLPFTIIRPSALYGERCVSQRVGQIFIENAMNNLAISINGDGADRLDFTYIDDLISGCVKVLSEEKSKNQIFNITHGQSRSIQEMIHVLSDFFPTLRVHYLPKNKLMPNRGTLSIQKAKNLLEYTPQFPLEKGFVKYIKWYQNLF